MTETFVNKIEYFLLKKQNKLTSKTLHIYQSLKQMNLLTPRFKYGILRIYSAQMQMIQEQELQIRNN